MTITHCTFNKNNDNYNNLHQNHGLAGKRLKKTPMSYKTDMIYENEC